MFVEQVGPPPKAITGFAGLGCGLYHWATHFFPGDRFMTQRALVRMAAFGLLPLMFASFVYSQQKERNRTQQPEQSATTAAAAQSPEDAKKEKNEGDPLFRGMKYRAIGPFRGGRSLTAAGIPGDPTIYYFGSTGGGVWEWNPAADTRAP